MRKMLFVFCFSISTIVYGGHNSLVIGGILDLGTSGNSGKALQFVAVEDIADLSVYAVGIANNGGGTDGIEANFPAVELAAGESFWFLYDSAAYQNYFGDVFGDYNVNFGYDSDLNSNGDDAIELFYMNGIDTALIDLYGDLDTDGTGEDWEFMDAWAFRKCDARVPSDTFNIAQWTIATPNCSDGSTTNADSDCSYPIDGCPSVQFNLNTSTANGFTDSSTLVLRGSFNGWAGNEWEMDNVGGDYWVLNAPVGLDTASYEFKYVLVGESGDTWESTSNRALTVAAGNTVLPQDYWENGTTPPYTPTDSVDVWFRVSTAGIVDYAGEVMHIAGSMNGWTGAALSPEGDSTFWSGQYSFAAGTAIEHKFIKGSDGWESNDNRTATVNQDTTLQWVYWSNVPPTDVQPVNVTFTLNTSTAPGFTDSTNTLVIRGSMNGWDGVEWELDNEGGDYWTYTTTTALAMGDYEYKYVMLDELENVNWESTDNRALSLSNETDDVDLAVDYWESGTTPPYTPTDSVDVWFRVSTAGIVGYAGEVMHIAGTMNGWTGEALTHEGDDFWSGQYSFAAGTATEHKFLKGSDGWESNDNRTALVTQDTTLAWVYWDNAPPSNVQPVTKTVIFSVDLSEWLDEEGATGMPIFSVARGDVMQVRGGFNGWNGDDPADSELTRTPGTNIFSLALSLTDLPDHENEYKFFIEHSEESVTHLTATYGELWSDMGWEDSPAFGGGNRTFAIGEDDGTGLLELNLAGYYDLPAGAVVPAGQEISVMFSVDMSGASEDGFDSAEDSVYIKLEDKWLNYLQGFDNGQKFVATSNGDGSYSATVDFVGPLAWHMIYHWEFLDVSESVVVSEGGGFGFGRFRARYMHSNSDFDCSWGDWAFDDDGWQKDPPLPVEEWDPDAVCVALSLVSDIVPTTFALSDNYPNPFNPTTNISFSIPMQLDVRINIYNIMGQLVANISQGEMNAGTYNIQWNGTDQGGNMLPSGLYFYELEAGNEFRQIKKMTLVK